MDENLVRTLDNYFNDELRLTLGYKLQFYKPTYVSEKRMILFKRKNKSRDFDIMLRNNPELTITVKQVLFDLLSNYHQGIYDIKLEFTNDSFAIQMLTSLLGYGIDFYFNLFKQFETPQQIDTFCITNKDAMELCRSNGFWERLFKTVYNFPSGKLYNYFQLYKEYLIYRFNGVSEKLFQNTITKEESNSIKNFIHFLIGEDLVKPENYNLFLWPIIYNDDEESWIKALSYYQNNEDKKRIFLNTLSMTNFQDKDERIKNMIKNFDYETFNTMFKYFSRYKLDMTASLGFTISYIIIFVIAIIFKYNEKVSKLLDGVYIGLRQNPTTYINYIVKKLYEISYTLGDIRYKQFADKIDQTIVQH